MLLPTLLSSFWVASNAAFVDPLKRHLHFSECRKSSVELSSTITSAYNEARFVRTQQGHEAAQPLYQQLLEENPRDITAATRIAAAPATPDRHDLAIAADATALRHDAQQLHAFLTSARYFNDEIVQLLGLQPALADTCAGPGVFLTAASAGSTAKWPFAMESPSALECLIAMFLLALAVPVTVLQQSIGFDAVGLFQRLGLAFPCQIDPALMIPYVHILPLTIRRETKPFQTLWLLTDLHPRVLSTTTVGKEDGTVMYIGPDSLALVQHYIASLSGSQSRPTSCIDLCTGSGIQALAALATMDSIRSATVLDINPRALRFARFNAILNRLDDRLQQYVLGDLVSGHGSTWQPDERIENVDASPILDILLAHSSVKDGRSHLLVLANPPFLPVPSYDTEIQRRYGLFSDGGGPSGELVLQAIVELSSAITNQSDTTTTLVDVGVVSEFMDPPFDMDGIEANRLLHRLRTWWVSSSESTTEGILFTNQYPVDAATYAQRRADDGREAQTWLHHLAQQGIEHVSPGLLYIRAKRLMKKLSSPEEGSIQLKHVLVPKTRNGSIWTPNNGDALTFINNIAEGLWR